MGPSPGMTSALCGVPSLFTKLITTLALGGSVRVAPPLEKPLNWKPCGPPTSWNVTVFDAASYLRSSPCWPELAALLCVESLPVEAEAALAVSDGPAGLAGGVAAAALVFGLVLTRPGSMLGRTRGLTGVATDAELARAGVLSEPVAPVELVSSE